MEPMEPLEKFIKANHIIVKIHVSKSGMTRRFTFLTVDENGVKPVLSDSKDGRFTVTGCGMNMLLHFYETLAHDFNLVNSLRNKTTII